MQFTHTHWLVDPYCIAKIKMPKKFQFLSVILPMVLIFYKARFGKINTLCGYKEIIS